MTRSNFDTKGKNILLIWESVNWGGVESWLCYLLNDWPSSDDNITVLSNKGNLGAERITSLLRNPRSIQLKFIHSSFTSNKFFVLSALGNLFCKLLTPLLFIIMVSKYYRFIKKSNFDIVLAVNGGYPAALGVLASIVASRLAKIPVRSLVVHHEASKALPFLGWFFVMLDYVLSYSLTSVICISKATQRALKDNSSLFFNQNLNSVIIHNGVNLDTEKKSNQKESRSSSKPLLGDSGLVRFAMVGRPDPYKGHEDVIAAMVKLPSDIMIKTSLVIVGSVTEVDKAHLIAFSKNLGFKGKLEFTGYLKGEIIEEIKYFDAVIVATRNFEGFGLTAAEAMVAKVPLISSTAGALEEFVSPEVATCFSPSNVEELSEIIYAFYVDPLPFKEKTQLADRHIQNYSSKKMAQRYRNHLEQSFCSAKTNN